MKLIRTEDAIGHVLCHDMTQIIKDQYKDARFRKGHIVTEKDIPVLLSMGNSDVPVGQYTQKIFEFYELDEQALAAAGTLTYGSNVKEVTTQVSEAAVDCGIIYGTDAASAKLTVVDTAAAEMCGQVIYPAAVLKDSQHPVEAKAFLVFLQKESSAKIFENVGFTPLG